MPRKPKEIPISFCLSLRARGWSYDMIAWKLNQVGYDVSRWTVMRRLRVFEGAEEERCGTIEG